MKIICIGSNYLEHIKELKSEDNNNSPLFFMKPQTAILPNKHPFIYPSFTKKLQFEIEIVLKICRLGKSIAEKFANTYYEEIGLGIDFTARDIQEECKKKGLPWEPAKAFDNSAVISEFTPKYNFKNLSQISFSLYQNGNIKQNGNTKDMLFHFDQIISHVSKFVTLKIGDLIFTGTPKGVDSVKIGDLLECYLEKEKMLSLKIK